MDEEGKAIAQAPPLVRDCCPVCGHQFDEVMLWNVCPVGPHYGQAAFRSDELITEDDDYAWVL